MKYVKEIEISLGIEAKKDYLPMQDGDVKATSANTELLKIGLTINLRRLLKKELKNS